MFTTSTQKQKVPTFENFLNCNNIDEVTTIKGEAKEKVESFAILPPILADEIYDEENMEASKILFKFISKIKNLRQPAVPETFETSSDTEFDPDMLGNVSVNDVDEDENGTAHQATQIYIEKEKASFYKIQLFLWCVMTDNKSIPGSPITVCNKQFTKRWEEEQHKNNIKQKQTNLPQAFMPQQHQNSHEMSHLINVGNQIGELTNVLNAKSLETLRDKDEEDNKGMKKFKKLSRIHQNVIKMFTLTEEHTAEDIESLEPAPGMLEIMASPSAADAQGLLAHLLKKNGNVAQIQPGICTALNKGLIIGTDYKSPTNLTPFGTYSTSTGGLSAKSLLKFAMKENFERYDKDELELLTSLEITIPKSYHVFQHMLRNMEFLCKYLSGQESLATRAWRSAVIHAHTNEQVYTDLADQDPNFYVSVMFHYHSRFHKCIESGANGAISQLLRQMLDFSSIFKDIDEDRYIIKAPLWAQEIPVSRYNQKEEEEGPEKKKQKTKRDKGRKIVNQNQCQELLCPAPLTYEQLFHPANRGGVKNKPHADGTIKCNNFHHHGYCWEKGCRYAGSHGKKLSDAEKEDSKEFLARLVKKYNEKHNLQKAVVPPGNPPQSEGTSTETPNK